MRKTYVRDRPCQLVDGRWTIGRGAHRWQLRALVPAGTQARLGPRSGSYAEGVFRILAILFLVVPILEIWVLIQAAEVVGGVNAIALMVLISAAAAFLVRRGARLAHALPAACQRGELPTKELLDGLLVAMAGALMLTPGFVTDAVGLLCLLPPSRAIIRTVLIARFGSRMTVTGPGFGGASGAGFGGPGFPGGEVPGDIIDVGDADYDRPEDPPELER